ncbi:MAG: sulfatase-like hydrolase/transferase [Candidatus Eisenbacteria bacterium]|uniref:Sulfatase-like hydrolase/transferase n=1 Tax=Eiseniibacteriota bacterium TaxID=2212470 RepID=A0A956NAK9_UNCEI|nr:sulfatase-like hydrolase/transferase [Candidatus Eisenbacteria bacterium]MCB9465211.1 sulfatase-like hydrolase/transferase [Candidatus Eisenbacteria bacterium]
MKPRPRSSTRGVRITANDFLAGSRIGLPTLLFTVLSTLSVGFAATVAAATNTAPANVLLIVMDDIGVDQVGVYEEAYDLTNHPDPCTPELDSFAQGAMRFTNAWSNPICSPTRSLIMTGVPACRSGIGIVTGENHPDSPGLDPDMYSIADMVRGLSGESAAIGKWHLAQDPDTADPNGPDPQWPYHPVPDPSENDPDDGLGFTYFQGSFANIGDYYDWTYTQILGGTVIEDLNHDTYATTQTTTDALQMFTTLEDESGDQPWLLYVAFNASHAQFHCPASGDCPDACTSETNWCEICGESPSQWGLKVQQTRAMTQTMDAAIGQLIDGAPENTAIIIIGDNGTPRDASKDAFDPFPGTGGVSHAKGTLYQGGINVPLIIKSPLATGNSGVCNQLVSASDLFATVAQFLQVNPPANPQRDSYSLARYTDGAYCHPCVPIDREYVYAERFNPNFAPVSPDGGVPAEYVATYHFRALRNATHKLIEKRTGTGIVREFYRLYDDVVGGPAPQDPAVLDDPDTGFNLSSAFETMNLLDEPNWTSEDIAAFEDLTCELADHYPALPVEGLVVSTAALTATRSNSAPMEGCDPTECTDSEITVRVDHPVSPLAKVIDRAVLEFDLRPLVLEANQSIASATLEVEIMDPAGSPTTAIAVKPYSPACGGSCDPLGDLCDCADAFDGIAGTSYANTSGWNQVGLKSIPLGGSITSDIEAALSTGTFSLALKIQGENNAGDDGVSLYPLGCGATLLPQLKLTYVGGGTALREAIPDDPELVGVEPSNFPNPFGSHTTIHYSVAVPAPVSIRIYNASGQLVRTLVDDQTQSAREYAVTWDGSNNAGNSVASGLYFYEVRVGSKSTSRPMMLMR